MAEFLKRLVMHREDAATRLPGIQLADLEVLFYGAEHSKWWKNPWGGMSADKAIWVQSGIDMPRAEADAQGKWRIFSKAGHGDGEFVSDAYVCLPVLQNGAPVPERGKELFLAMRLAEGGGSDVGRDRLFATYHQKILAAVQTGALK